MVNEHRERTDRSIGAVLVTPALRAACRSLRVAAPARSLDPPESDAGQADLGHGSTWNALGSTKGGLPTRRRDRVTDGNDRDDETGRRCPTP
jgi:hypothetical protein